MKTTFNWGQDNTYDSRDLISRHQELQDEFDSLVESLDSAKEDFEDFLKVADEELKEDNEEFEHRCKSFRDAIEDAQEALNQFNQSFDKDELDTLTEVISQGEDSPDWAYGEILIKDDFFQTYIEDLINDCYDLPKEFNSGEWPYRHLQLNLEDAAAEALSDYSEIDVNGYVYYIRA